VSTKLVVKTIAGSHLYGVNVPESDQDFKGVVLPYYKDILLQKDFGSKVLKTNADPNAKNTSADVDFEIHTLQRYLKLLMEGQTIALDMLFTPEQYILDKSPIWDVIVQNKMKFLHKGMSSFVGYCQSQANKYSVKAHRLAAAERICLFLSAKMNQYTPHVRLSDVESELENVVETFQTEQKAIDGGDPSVMCWTDCEGPTGPVKHLEVCGRKTPIHNTLVKAFDVYKRVLDNYGRRAHAAMTLQGDYKALYHAVRVASEAKELLLTGHITLPRPEAPLLLKIRKGELPFRQVGELIERGLIDVEEALEKTTLPDHPDREFADDLICEIYGRVIAEGRTYVQGKHPEERRL